MCVHKGYLVVKKVVLNDICKAFWYTNNFNSKYFKNYKSYTIRPKVEHKSGTKASHTFFLIYRIMRYVISLDMINIDRQLISSFWLYKIA